MNKIYKEEQTAVYAGEVSERSKMLEIERRVSAIKHHKRWETFRERRTELIMKYASLRRFYFWSRKIKGHIIIVKYLMRVMNKSILIRQRNLLGFFIVRWLARSRIRFRKINLNKKLEGYIHRSLSVRHVFLHDMSYYSAKSILQPYLQVLVLKQRLSKNMLYYYGQMRIIQR